jgi:sugar lactone lactonase YvrE
LAVDPDSGATRVAVDDVFAPSAVKFDHRGRLVVTEAGAGNVTVVDLATGDRRVLAHIAPGLDNLAFADTTTMYVSSFVTGAIYRIGLVDGDTEVRSSPGLITANGLSPANDGGLIVSDRLSVVEVDRNGALRRLACLPVDMQFSISAAVMTGATLCVLTNDGRLMRRPSSNQPFAELTLSGSADSPTCLTLFGSLLLVGAGTDALAVDQSGMVHRQIATGLRITALAAHEDSVVVCERGTGTVALFDRGTATVWTGFSDPAAVAITADTVFVAEEAARRVVCVARTTGERTVAATDLPFGSPLATHANGVGPPSLCAAADGSVFVGCSGDASVRRLSRS